MVGIIRVPNLLGRFGVDSFNRHIKHVVDLIGADHVGIGSDNGGMNWNYEPDEMIEASRPETFKDTPLKGSKRSWEWETKPNSFSWTNAPYFTVGGVPGVFGRRD